jgi:3',5'-cyclic AMP phosphodiesterase CpdA
MACVFGMFHKVSLFHMVHMAHTASLPPDTPPEPNSRKATAMTPPIVPPTFPPMAATEPPEFQVPRVRPDPHQHALLIPYRNRTFHLTKFMEYMRPYLQRHFPDDVFTLYVVEQDDDQLFNRGWLTNVGLDMIQHLAPKTQCITLHDVDLIPNGTSHVPYTSCVDRPIHLATKMENFNWAIPYGQYCGGITALSLTHWREINGMSNDYQGALLTGG